MSCIFYESPSSFDKSTPLHYAALRGHMDICRLIINNVDNKHPVNKHGVTPKELAVQFGHIAVSQLFEF